MRTFPSPASGTNNDPHNSSIASVPISVNLVKAFVQPDGSHGNGAGVVLLPGLPHTQVKEGSVGQEPLTNDECLQIAKRVGLPETSFVFFPEKNEMDSENNLVLKDDGGQNDNSGVVDEPKERADFFVKWFTPECEVDMCGHATIALVGYIHSIIKEKSNSNVRVNCNVENRRPNEHFWKMQCKAGLLGIEVMDDVPKDMTATNGLGKIRPQTRESNERNNHTVDSLPRVVMEQALPEFCGIVDCNEIASSLNIQEACDLAITVTKSSSVEHSRVFPFSHCEIVSTGGRDLMIPIRSTILKEMNILGRTNTNPDHDTNASINEKQIQQLGRNIDIASKRYNIVGYHMFEVDDSLFQRKRNSECEELKASSQVQEKDADSSISLNKLIRIFQVATEMGNSGEQSCLEAVGINKEDWQDGNEIDANRSRSDDNDRGTGSIAIPAVRKSRTILVTGVRNFAPAVGIPEEPATGSANGALACYLVKHMFLGGSCGSGRSSFDHQNDCSSLGSTIIFRFCMEQGRAMGEPCLIDAEIEVTNGSIRSVKVGGLVSVTGDSLDLDLTSIQCNV